MSSAVQRGQCAELVFIALPARSRPLLQGGANDFGLVPGEYMSVRKGRRCVNKLFSIKRPGRINQMTSTDLNVSCRGQLGADEVSFIGKQEESVALGSDVDAGPVFRCRHAVRAPNLPSGGGFQANQLAGGPAAIDVFTLRQGRRGVAQDSFRGRTIL